MSKKSNIILSIIIVSFIISVCSIGVVQDNPSTQIEKQDDDIITELSVPETSGYTVTEKWRWNNTFTGSQNANQVEISKDGNYIVTRWGGGSPNVTLHKIDSNSTVWIYECASAIEDVAISWDGQYIVVSNASHVIFLNNSIGTPKTALWEYDVGSNCFVDISLTGDYISAINNTHIFLLNKNGQLIWAHDTQSTIDNGVIAISGDGRHIITGFNNRFYLFNTTDYEGSPMWNYYHDQDTTRVALSDDGMYAVASNNVNHLYFFNTTDYDQLGVMPFGIPMWSRSFGGNFIYDIAISSDGKNVAVAGTDKFYYFNNSFSTGEKQPMWSSDPTIDTATSVDITADGKFVLGATRTVLTAYLFNNSITNPKEAEWKSSNIKINDVAISGWGNYFVIGTQTEEIILFHHDRPIPQWGYAVNERWNFTSEKTVNIVAVSADGKYMAVGTDMDPTSGPELFFFNTSNHDGIPEWSYNADERFESLAISANGKYIVAGSAPGNVYIFNSTKPGLGEPKQYMWVEPSFDILPYVDISADGKLIVMGGKSANNGELFLYNILGDQLWTLQLGPDPYIPLSVAISADGKYVAVGRKDVEGIGAVNKTVYFFNTTDYVGQSQDPMWTFDTGQDMDSIAISKYGEYIVAGSCDGKIAYLFNSSVPEQGNNKLPVWNFSLENLGVNVVDISADGKDIVLGIEDSDPAEDTGFIILLNNSRPKLDPYDKGVNEEWLWIYETAGNINSVSITADGQYVVAGTDYIPDIGDINENTVFLFNNTDYTIGASHDPNWFFNTYDHVNSVSISAWWGNYIGIGGESTSGETFLFYHARPVPGAFRPYIAGGDDDDDDDETAAIPFGNYYLIFAAIAIVALIVIIKRKTILFKK